MTMETPSKAYIPPSNRRGLTGDRKLLKLTEVATVIDIEFALPGAYLIIVQLTDPSNPLSQTIAHVRIITGVARTPTSDVTTIVNGVNQVVLARSVTVIVENSERDAVVAPAVLDVRAVVVPITIEAAPSLFGSPEGIFPFGPSVSVDGIDGRVRSCVERTQEALRRFRALGDRASEPSTITNVGFWLMYAGDRARGEPFIREGLEAARAVGARPAEAYAYMAIADMGEIYGDWTLALEHAETALAVAREIGHLEWTAAGLSVLGRLYRNLGEPRRARALHDEMLRLTRELGSVIWIADALGEVGEDADALGDTAAGAALLDESVATGGPAAKFVVRSLVAQAALQLRLGAAEAALESARRVRERMREIFGPDIEWSDELLQPASNRHWLTRMLQNLLNIFGSAGQYNGPC